MNKGRREECTQTCRSRQHGGQITASILRGTEAQAIAYMKNLCQRCCFVTDKTGKTALHTAASCGKRKVVKWLLSQGAQLNQRDSESGYTPLHRALFYGQVHVACTLIQAGCSLSALDYDALTPLDHVNFDRPPEIVFRGFLPTQVYVWGSNTNYNLGQTSQQARQTPECLETVNREGHWITDVALSKFHTVFVSSNGRVYTCGHGQGGRLGLDTNDPILSPRPVKTFTHINVVKAAVGPDHSLFLTDSGQVFSCGSNFHHQLGLTPPPEHVYTPRLLSWHKSHKDVVIAGIGAAKYHSVMWTPRMLYTFGLNAGQLGFLKNANEHTVITPKNVTSIVLKEDVILTCVGVSDGATVLSTSNGDVYVLHQYQIRKVASKMPDIVKIACIGGDLDSKIGEAGLKEHGDELKIAVLIGKNIGHLYLWTQQTSHISRCVFSINRKISVVDFCLGRHCLGIVTDDGEAFSGILPTRIKEVSDKVSIRKVFRPTGQLVEFLDYGSCITVRLVRLPALHRTVSIMCDPKGQNFAALQVEMNTFLVGLPKVSSSSMREDFSSFFNETDEMDTLHDAVIVCGNYKFPAHSYVLACYSGYFCHQLIGNDKNQHEKEWSMYEENGKKYFVFPDIQPDLFREILTYMYSGSCSLLFPDTDCGSGYSKVYNDGSADIHNTNGSTVNNNVGLHQRSGLSDCREELESYQLSAKQRRRKNRKNSGMKTKQNNLFPNFEALANKLQFPALLREIEIKKAVLEESDHKDVRKVGLGPEGRFKRMKYKELWDVTITSKNGDKLSAHKCILAARLEYFRCMFSAGWMEASSCQSLSMPLPTNILTVLLDYLYEDDSPLLRQCRDAEFVCSVLTVADQFLVDRLREICEKVLTDLMSLRNVADLFEFASRYNATSLKSSAMEFICLNIASLLENGSLLSINSSDMMELSKYYQGFVTRMSYRVLTPHDVPPYAEELEQLLEEKPLVLPESDEDWEENCKEDKPLTPGGGPGSVRKKKRQHRNSQGDLRSRKTSTSSSVSISSTDYDPCKDLEDNFGTFSFDDLEERKPSASTSENAAPKTTPVDIPLTSPCSEKSNAVHDGWQRVSGKRSTSSRLSPLESLDKKTPFDSPDKETNVQFSCVSPPTQVHRRDSLTDIRTVDTSVPLFPTLQDSIVSAQKNAASSKTNKMTKLSQKQRKKLAAEAQKVESVKDDQQNKMKPSNPWGNSTSAWGTSATNDSQSLFNIMKAEETKVKSKSPATSVHPSNNGMEQNKKQGIPCDSQWKKRNSEVWSGSSSYPSTTPPVATTPVSPDDRILDNPGLSSPQGLPSTPSFSNILLEEETLSNNLTKERSKPLALIQMEDRAIEELLAFYGAAECYEEKITVTRVKKHVLRPVWNK